MATSQIDYAALAAQARGSAPNYTALAEQVRQGGGITDNPNSEGTYKMVGPKGESVSVPFSKVRGAQDQRYMIAPSDAGRYTKDSTGSTRQGVQADFDARMNTSPNESLMETGVKSVVHGAGQMFVHPADTVMGAVQGAISDPITNAANVIAPVVQSYRDARSNGSSATRSAAYAGIKPAGEMAGQAATAALVGDAVAPVISRLPTATRMGVQGFKNAAYPSNLALDATEATAQNVVRALQPDVAAIPNVKSATPELGDALAYAEKNNIPQNGKLDTAKALKGRAAEIQSHYDDAVLKPNAADIQAVPDNYDGTSKVGAGRATLGDINDRVNFINRELKTNFRKKLASQTSEANAADADLNAEKFGLTDILHNRLSELTGIAPEDIADMRQRAGKLRSLAQEVEVSADKDTVGAGRRETSGGTVSLKNPVDAIQDKVGGGQEIIGNRVWKNTLEQIPATNKPLPAPMPPGPDVSTTPEAAQAEFLRANQLEQSAQDASTQRGQQAANVRLNNRVAQGSQLWAGQGYDKVLSHLSNDASSGLTRGSLVKIGLTPQGRALLIRASDLTPGSAAMKNLVKQIQAVPRN